MIHHTSDALHRVGKFRALSFTRRMQVIRVEEYLWR